VPTVFVNSAVAVVDTPAEATPSRPISAENVILEPMVVDSGGDKIRFQWHSKAEISLRVTLQVASLVKPST